MIAKTVHKQGKIKVNTEESKSAVKKAVILAAETLHVECDEIADIAILKKGMTNRSFLFTCRKQKYIMRIPGEGTQQLINRSAEAEVYRLLKGKNICDNVIYINPDSGYKITEFMENARVCDPFNQKDLEICMEKLRTFHEQKFAVKREFNIFEQIEFYEALWNGKTSVYEDYNITKGRIMSLQSYINAHMGKKVLAHIDAVPDNFLITDGEGGESEVRLIDWEYAGMQDPHVDIAMFCIYSLYSKKQADHLIDIYFQQKCSDEIRVKIYCYMAACGLLWSNWCEYKAMLGIQFGEYSLRQYQFAKEYYQIVRKELQRGENGHELHKTGCYHGGRNG